MSEEPLNFEDMSRNADRIHAIWYEFCDYMKEYFYVEETTSWEKNDNGDIASVEVKPFKVFDVAKMKGYDAMQVVEEYAETHPDIVLVGCDDVCFTGSLIILVPHPDMGITVIYIPQNSVAANEFFLYPYHIKMLQEALAMMKEKYGLKGTL